MSDAGPEDTPQKQGFVCCPPGCASCGVAFSIWGVITLVIVGIMLNTNYQFFLVGYVCDDDLSKSAMACYIAAGIYAVIGILSGVRLWWFKRQTYQTV